MRKPLLTLIGVASFATAVVMAVWLLVEPLNAVALDVEPGVSQDVGTIRQGESAKAHFTLRNRAAEPIRILHVGTSCSCTTWDLSQRQLTRGESSQLTLTLDSGLARDEIAVEAVVVYQRRGQNQYYSLKLEAHGQIDPMFATAPKDLTFVGNTRATTKLVITPREQGSQLESVSVNRRFFAAKVLPQSEGKAGRFVVEVTFDPEGYYPEAGPAELTIQTSSKLSPLIVVPLHVESFKG